MPGGLAPPPGPAERGAERARSDGSAAKALLRGVGLPALVAVAVGTAFVVVFLAAFSRAVPHDLPIGVAGPADQVEAAATALEREQPGAFDVVRLPDGAAAERAVRSRDAYGALVLGGPTPSLVVAGANGQGVQQTLTQAVTGLRLGAAPQVRDVAPRAPGDTRGLAIFYTAFGVVLGGFLFGITTYQVAPKLVLRYRILSALLFAAASGVVVAVLGDAAFGAVPAGFGAVAGLVGLLALAMASTAGLLLRLLGAAGTFVTSVGLLILGNATSTGNLPAEFLPGWLEPLAGILPPGVAVRALRGAAYFGGDGVPHALVVLPLWSVLPVLVVAGVDALGRRRDQRHR